MSTPEQVIQQRLLLRFGSMPDLRIWRENVGVAWQPITPQARAAFEALRRAHSSGFRPVHYGTPGAADVQGILAPAGRYVAIEVKADGGRLSDEQRRWGTMFEKHGGLYVIAKGATAENDVAAALEGARHG